MTAEPELPRRPEPFDGDRQQWVEQVRFALAAQEAERLRRGSTTEPVAGPLPVEATTWGWIRWSWPPGDEVYFDETFPQEIGVFDPAGGTQVRLARAVWGRRPLPLRLESVGSMMLPFPLSVGRCAVVVAAVLLGAAPLGRLLPGWGLAASAVLGAGTAWGVPAILRAASRRRVRVVEGSNAALLFGLLAAQQFVARAAAVGSGVEELDRAVALGHRFLWDGVGLVRSAGPAGEELAVLNGYEEAYRRLARASVAVLRDRADLEGTIVYAGGEQSGPTSGAARGRRRRPVEQAAPAELLHEVSSALEELAAGLRHARTVVCGTTYVEAPEAEKGDGDVER